MKTHYCTGVELMVKDHLDDEKENLLLSPHRLLF